MTLSGSTNQRSQPFHLGTGQKRLLYNVVGSEMPGLSVYVVAQGDSLEQSGGFPEVSPDVAGPGETVLVQDEGDYYLDVSSANCTWQVTVQEMK